jgi:REP element-mobilizing transposase RayT
MAKRNTPFSPGQYYHLYNRGSSKQKIFIEEDNYLYVLRYLKNYAVSLDISIIAYCLMPNHYHFLLRQDSETPAGLLVQRTFNRYSKAFNRRYNRTGTLFEGPYKSIHIDKYSYLLQICRYIHVNPVKAGLVKDPADWPYSNYLEWIGNRQGYLVNEEFISDNFVSESEYKMFVRDYLLGIDQFPEEIKSYIID